MMGTLTELIVAAILFTGSHIAIPSTGVRARIVGAIGARAYMVFYSILSTVLLVWFVAAFFSAPQIPLWTQREWMRIVVFVTMPFACILLVAGLFTANATVATDARLPEGPDPAPGILKVTRHPVFWAIGLWAAAHLIVNGNAAALIFFGSLVVLSMAGTRILDLKHARTFGPAWPRFASVTSVVPFAATMAGRNRVSLSEIGWWKIAGGLALFVVLLALHPMVIGKNPLPWQ